MDYREYLDDYKELYNVLIRYIEDENNDNESFHNLITLIEKQEIKKSHEEMILFFNLLIQISNNHHRFPTFFTKIEKIILTFSESIKDNFTNYEIFDIFQSNKILILFLIDNKFIIIDENIVKRMMSRSQKTKSKYHYFFYSKIKDFLKNQELEEIKNEFNDKEQTFLDSNFENKCKIGENESYICKIIRNDSYVDFISYVYHSNFSLHNKIKPSIFETNNFLIKNEPSLIEYAAFYGSIQIFQYLEFNKVEMKPILWLYAIHSQNTELIHLLEESSVQPPDNSYKSCFDESIKCHHNNIANYLKDQKLGIDEINYKFIFRSFNYQQIPYEFKCNKSIFYFMCRYNYSELIKLYIEPKKRIIKEQMKILLLYYYDISLIIYFIMFYTLLYVIKFIDINILL